jgi:hypothetical protein
MASSQVLTYRCILFPLVYAQPLDHGWPEASVQRDWSAFDRPELLIRMLIVGYCYGIELVTQNIFGLTPWRASVRSICCRSPNEDSVSTRG